MPESILIVDEAASNRKLTQRVLSAAGYDVRAVPDADAALKSIAAFPPQLVLTELRLSGMDGLALTRRIKDDPKSAATVVIAVTGCDTEEVRQAAAGAGCDDFIAKPIDTRTLPAVVQSHLARREQHLRSLEAPPAGPADLPPWAEELRRAFLAGVEVRCTRLLDPGVSSEKIRTAVRLWAGMAGTFGYPEISDAAWSIYHRLSRPDTVPADEIGARLQRLLTAFRESTPSVKASAAAPTAEYTERLAGRIVAVVGMEGTDASRLGPALQAAHTRVLGAVPERGADCDLVIAGPGADMEPLLARVGAEPDFRLLWVGVPDTAVRPHRVFELEGFDFVTIPWTLEEVLTRACRLVGLHPVARPDTSCRDARKWKVVIADGDPATAGLLKSNIERSGMECRVVRDGDDVLQLIRSLSADAVILDIAAPNLSRLEVLAAIRNDPDLRKIRVLVLSEVQQESEIVRAFALGADDHIAKPFHPLGVVARLQRLQYMPA